MYKLRGETGNVPRALEMVVLTACRSGEVRLSLWDEFDLPGKVWTIPKDRTKTSIVHTVPLTEPMLAVLEAQAKVRRKDGLVFPGRTVGSCMSDSALRFMLGKLGYGHITVHGFRSSFRDWCGDATDHPREIAEAALGHASGNSTKMAYRRGNALAKRAGLMRDWNAYCDHIIRPPLALPAQIVE